MTGPTNPGLRDLINELKKASAEQEVNIWKRVAKDLERPSRNRRAVNLGQINKHAKDDETVIVPGKVLGSGMLDRKLTIAAFQFSKGALEKIAKVGAKSIYLTDIVKDSHKGKKLRIMG